MGLTSDLLEQNTIMYGLQLQTQHLGPLHHFYSEIVGFPILNETHTYFRTQVGATILDFEQVNHSAQYCFRIGLPMESFNMEMDNLSARVDIKSRRSVFHPKLKHTWYFHDPSNNIVELSPDRYNEPRITGIVMLVEDTVKVGEQLESLGLTCRFTDQFRCIFQNPDDRTDIILIKTRVNQYSSGQQAVTIPTVQSSVNATVCLENTSHYLYMVKS